MKTISEMTWREIVQLSEIEIAFVKKLILAEKGIIDPGPFTLVKPVEPEMVSDKLMYQVGDVAFDTMEQASAFVALNPKKLDYQFDCGYDYKYPRLMDTTITLVKCYTQDKVEARKAELVMHKTKRSAYDQAFSDHRKAEKAVTEALAEVNGKIENAWSVYRDVERYTKIFQEYVELAEGNVDVASSFFIKLALPSGSENAIWEVVDELRINLRKTEEAPQEAPITSETLLEVSVDEKND